MIGACGMATRIHFVTGTDTGVGKTVLAACLLYYFRRTGKKALAAKPFAAGGRDDVKALQRLQGGELTDDQCNPFFFPAPIAPYVANRASNRHIGLQCALRHIASLQDKCDILVIEGIGGVMVPLGRGYGVRDLILHLDCEVWVAARNRLGTINHSLLTVLALRQIKPLVIRLVLMNQTSGDMSSRSNKPILRGLLTGVPVGVMPFLDSHPVNPESLKKRWKKVEKVLAPLLRSSNFCPRFPNPVAIARQKRC